MKQKTIMNWRWTESLMLYKLWEAWTYRSLGISSIRLLTFKIFQMKIFHVILKKQSVGFLLPSITEAKYLYIAGLVFLALQQLLLLFLCINYVWLWTLLCSWSGVLALKFILMMALWINFEFTKKSYKIQGYRKINIQITKSTMPRLLIGPEKFLLMQLDRKVILIQI
jgi:hypothetical protein